MYGVEGIQQIFKTYAGETVFLQAFLICLIYGFCSGRESGRKRVLLMFLLSVLFVFNNLSIKLLGKVTDPATFYRFIWAVPILPLIAWAGVKAVYSREKRWERAAVLGLMFCVFWSGRSSFVTEGTIRVPENVYNIPEDVIQVCQVIDRDKKEQSPVVIFDYECQMWARLYDPSLVWGIRRNAYQFHNDMEGYENAGKYKHEKIMIHAVNYGVKGEQEKLSKALDKKDVDYIVTPTEFQMDAYLEEVGYQLVDTAGRRSVYARK